MHSQQPSEKREEMVSGHAFLPPPSPGGDPNVKDPRPARQGPQKKHQKNRGVRACVQNPFLEHSKTFLQEKKRQIFAEIFAECFFWDFFWDFLFCDGGRQ
jgi:hypothetical protein